MLLSTESGDGWTMGSRRLGVGGPRCLYRLPVVVTRLGGVDFLEISQNELVSPGSQLVGACVIYLRRRRMESGVCEITTAAWQSVSDETPIFRSASPV